MRLMSMREDWTGSVQNARVRGIVGCYILIGRLQLNKAESDILFVLIVMKGDTCKIMTDIKKCKNVMCGKIIYHYQNAWQTGYCDKDCSQEVRHWRSKNEPLKRRGRFSEIITHYPHRLYPDTVLIIPENEQH
jgi:hypothetical protein